MLELANSLKLLGDDTRLRILRLIAREPLNVSEITSILGLAQSGISRHLSLLRKAGLVEERREGIWTYYSIQALLAVGGHGEADPGGFSHEEGNRDSASGLSANGNIANGNGNGVSEGALGTVWDFVREQLSSADDPFSDLPRLTEVLRQRENFGGGLNEKLLEPGQSWFAWSRALHFLLPPLEAIDLGCGDGTITVEISRFASRVVGVDANARAIEAAKKRAERERRENVEFKLSRIEDLKEPDASFDLAVYSQSLHHMERPEVGLKAARRLLRPGGRLIVVDLAPHKQGWVREKLGHAHLGFEPEHLTAMLKQAGFTRSSLEEVHQRRGEVFRVILASAVPAE